MSSILIVGCGYVGTRLARQYLEQGQKVLGLTRSAAGLARLEAAAIAGVRRDLASDPLDDLPWADSLVVHCAPPPASGVEDPLTRRLVETFAATGSPRRILYLSTSGVYGDCAGRWIDESHAVRPTAERSRRRWDAEETLRRWSHASGRELVILRVAGIYGPDRLPLARIRAAAPMVRPEQSPYTNRIHVDDLVTLCQVAMERAPGGAVYNACDGAPSTMTEYFQAVAAAAGLPGPPLISLEEAGSRLSEGMLSYLSESRRLRNDRMRTELGIALRYPTLADGLRAILGAEGASVPSS
ncbi:MAG: SDR family oxidoreductase [Sphingobacteriia bacterium]|nr:SDR family oxidoreductase [Sphingobacteriia bacterium]NCC38144.1 SDR family oxidoreductase [Gammaproteobacteria bacterium]